MDAEPDMKKLAEQWVKAIQNKETLPDLALPIQHPLWIVLEGVKAVLEKKDSLDMNELTQQLTEQMQSMIPSNVQQPPSGQQKDSWRERGLYLCLALSASIATVLFLQWGMGQIPLTGKEMRLAAHLAQQGLLEPLAKCQSPFQLMEGGLCRPESKIEKGELILPAWKAFP